MANVSAGLQRGVCLGFFLQFITSLAATTGHTEAIGTQKTLPSFLLGEITSAVGHFNPTEVKNHKIHFKELGT